RNDVPAFAGTNGEAMCGLKRGEVMTVRHTRSAPSPACKPNSGLPEFGRFLTGRSRINPTSAGGVGRGHLPSARALLHGPPPPPRPRTGGRGPTEPAAPLMHHNHRVSACGSW